MNHLGSRELETERLLLCPQTVDEQKYLWSVLMTPEVYKYYLTVPVFLRDKLKDWSKQEKHYIDGVNKANNNDVYKWSVFLKDNNKCIGLITCQEKEDCDDSIRDVGWYIDPKYQGNGYATEAAIRMIDYMFRDVGIDKILTGAAVVNPSSWKIMEKLGFKRLDDTVMVQYTYMDELVEVYQYILTKEMYFKEGDYNES